MSKELASIPVASVMSVGNGYFIASGMLFKAVRNSFVVVSREFGHE